MFPLVARVLGLPYQPCAGPGQLIAGDYYYFVVVIQKLMLFDADFEWELF